MKRLLIGVVAVAGLLGSVLALVASSTNPASGQTTAPITLRNTETRLPNATNPIAEDQVRVSVVPLQGCTPRTGGAINGQILQPSGTTGDILVVSLDTNCSWQVTFAQVANTCVTTGLVNNNSNTNAANTAVAGNPIAPTILINGLGAGGGLQYTGSADADGNPATPRTPVAAITPTKIDFSISATLCATNFMPVATIGLPTGAVTTGNTLSSYAGLEFEVTYTTNRQGQLAPLCTTGTSTYVVNDNGAVVPKMDSNNMPMLANLINTTLGDLGGTGRCTYTASFSAEVGGLRPATNIRGEPDVRYPTGRSDISGETVGTTNTVSISYVRITVPIVVRSTFPADEVFTTEDRVGYTVSVDSPCGGYLGVLPRGLGNQGDSASAQVFPGTVLVYGSQLRAVTQGATQMRTYSVTAFNDVRGTMACSVTVTEDSGPERCSVVGGASSTQTYSAGDAALTFEFTHTCEPTAAASTDDAEGEASTNGPPAPPAIDLGDGDTATTPSGPPQEGRTG